MFAFRHVHFALNLKLFESKDIAIGLPEKSVTILLNITIFVTATLINIGIRYIKILKTIG